MTELLMEHSRRNPTQWNHNNMIWKVSALSALVVIVFLVVMDEGDSAALKTYYSSPVIGILAQPTNNTALYIAASYVKWVEAGGARSVAITDETDELVLDTLFQQIDGILFPGGATAEIPFVVSYLLRKAVESNRQGNYFPIWGTCLGMEFLVRYVSGDDSVLQSGYTSENVSLALENVVSKELYRNLNMRRVVTELNVTLNNHELGLHPATFWSNEALQKVWEITSINHDSNGRPFVSTLEPVSNNSMPFYAVQYHPEKNAFEYATYPHTDIPYESINHSEKAVDFSIAMARFMVNLARYTPNHHYTLPDTFPYVYTYPKAVGLGFEEVYVIPTSEEKKKGSLQTTSKDPTMTQ